MEEKAEEYAEYIPDKTIDALIDSKCDKVIATNEPTEFIERILSNAGILNCFTKIKGNKFKIYNGIIISFDRYDLRGGQNRKNKCVEELNQLSKYTRIDALGDSRADIGMYEHAGHINSKVRLYAVEDASKEFKQYVGKENVVKSIAEFLRK